MKDEIEKEKRVRQIHDKATQLLSVAEQADSYGNLGTGAWAHHHCTQPARIISLLEILDNPAVAHGAIV